MNRARVWTATVLVSAAGLAPVVVAAKSPAEPPATVSIGQAEKNAAAANNAFGLDLYRLVSKDSPGKNLLLSPYSMSVALTMTAEGARGRTAEEMWRVLQVPAANGDELTAIHAGYAGLAKYFHAAAGVANGAYDLRVANALWVAQGYPLSKQYVSTIGKWYGAGGVTSLDIKGQNEQSRLRINTWAEEKTEKRIQNLIPEGKLDRETRLVITNAVYFKGEWSAAFGEGQTKEEEFKRADGSKVRAMMMQDRARPKTLYAAFNADGTYFETPWRLPMSGEQPATYPGDAGFSMISLPYKGGELSMVLIAPRTYRGLDAIEQKLMAKNLEAWLAKLESRTVNIAMPRFKMTSEHNMMSKVLAGMGMKRAFTDPSMPNGAEFGGMTDSKDPDDRLYINTVLQKAWVEVNEKGTEAAAATAVLMAPSPSVPTTIPFTPVFRADRPFLFLIRDGKSGAVLFVGRVMDPTK